MGTPAVIAIKEGDKVTWSSVNYDGYISHAGRILVEHYGLESKVKGLIALGDLSVLDKSIECPEGHTFTNRVYGYTLAYSRDRGETNTESQTADWFMFLRSNKGIIKYVFEDGNWYNCRWVSTASTKTFIEQFELIRVDEILSGAAE